eukprot:768041-Hanusia_phi.AAC.6
MSRFLQDQLSELEVFPPCSQRRVDDEDAVSGDPHREEHGGVGHHHQGQAAEGPSGQTSSSLIHPVLQPSSLLVLAPVVLVLVLVLVPVRVDPTILDLDEVELREARMVDGEPILIVRFVTQQVHCVRNQKNEVVEGGESEIRQVSNGREDDRGGGRREEGGGRREEGGGEQFSEEGWRTEDKGRKEDIG